MKQSIPKAIQFEMAVTWKRASVFSMGLAVNWNLLNPFFEEWGYCNILGVGLFESPMEELVSCHDLQESREEKSLAEQH